MLDRKIMILLGCGVISLQWIGPRVAGRLKGTLRQHAGVLELCRASGDERRRPVPGDELVPHPRWVITHAITINAPPQAVWPWVV
jgi:hypothetical protein